MLVLVLVALVLSTVSIVYNMVDSNGEKVIEVNTKHIINGKDISGGQVGVNVLPTPVEDKNE